jgi:DNA-binding transcriptional MerR regulator
MPTAAPAGELTIDDLAHQAQLPVRTIREYHTIRLLPPPRRAGRVGIYGQDHAHRLELIARLQRRGYSLAGIRDLLEAWDAGTNLPAVLGVEPGTAALDETPLRLTRAELFARLPGLTTASVRRACSVGLAQPDGPDHFFVRSPALLVLAADAVHTGLQLTEILDLIGVLGDELTTLAEAIADLLVNGIWQPLVDDGRLEEVEQFLQRGRVLLLQGVASTLADRLGSALLHRAGEAPSGDALRATIEHIRVGAITDSAGNIRRINQTGSQIKMGSGA